MPQLRPIEIISTWRDEAKKGGENNYLVRIRGMKEGESKILSTRDSPAWVEDALNWAFEEGRAVGRAEKVEEARKVRAAAGGK